MAKLVLAGLETMAEEMGCSKKTLYRWIRERGFPAFKLDGTWRALPGEVELWLMEQRAQQEGRQDPLRMMQQKTQQKVQQCVAQ